MTAIFARCGSRTCNHAHPLPDPGDRRDYATRPGPRDLDDFGDQAHRIVRRGWEDVLFDYWLGWSVLLFVLCMYVSGGIEAFEAWLA